MKTHLLFISILFAVFAKINAQTTMNIYQSNGTVLQIPIINIDSITYTINNQGNLATIETYAIDNISSSSATSGGIISSNGGSTITHRGVCWSISPNPTTSNSLTHDGNGTGSFGSNLSNLTTNTTYYVRAYAINSAGTAYGNQQIFITTNSGAVISNPGSGITYNGFTYSSIILGNGQEWMVENLRTTNYRNGDPIPSGLDDAAWSSTTVGAYAIYNNDTINDTIYGKLYNWYAVTDPRHICPMGWHEPSDAEWTMLAEYLGGEEVAGSKMKSTGTQYWNSPNTDATNESGFSGLPGGYRMDSGSYSTIGIRGDWWSNFEYDNYLAWSRFLSYNYGNAYPSSNTERSGLSVRCLRD